MSGESMNHEQNTINVDIFNVRSKTGIRHLDAGEMNQEVDYKTDLCVKNRESDL